MGNCQYLLAGYSGDAETQFSVQVQHRNAWDAPRDWVTMCEKVWINLPGYQIHIFVTDPVDGEGFSKFTGSEITILEDNDKPISTYHFKKPEFEMINTGIGSTYFIS